MTNEEEFKKELIELLDAIIDTAEDVIEELTHQQAALKELSLTIGNFKEKWELYGSSGKRKGKTPRVRVP